ncbi:SIS domain-containing protein [Flagellimonas algicola]|uniref:SIS domain-containing protein n=1 Tax=Flagellimonas algicola TaxID=2583815 RepID=A0ABY2WHG0_9FLAO|nr:SIS domain-containing protein [Allomuricauda algicola]TMU50703.1 SIS domain-containing protein [Allomuricauda algicola]
MDKGDEYVTNKSGGNTLKEINAQPRLWQETYAMIKTNKPQLVKFLGEALVYKNLKVILTGAGTSSYIGEVLSKSFEKRLGRVAEAVASTDLITNPKDFLSASQPTLIISFARSGESPESIAAVDLAEQYCERAMHLIVTCNPQGKLVKHTSPLKSNTVVMPKDSNDKGLAMTSSFTTMLLAGLLISDLGNLDKNKKCVDALVKYGKKILEDYKERIYKVAQLNFDRVVFLGSGILKGIARESQLKVQELTDGQVVCKYDSFLGLRHGPKVVIKDSTLVVYIFSSNPLTNKYEYDLVKSINSHEQKLYEIGIAERLNYKDEINLNLSIELAENDKYMEEYFAISAVIPSQLLGLYKSLNLGLSPDTPSRNNAINRVVKGVNIYKQ